MTHIVYSFWNIQNKFNIHNIFFKKIFNVLLSQLFCQLNILKNKKKGIYNQSTRIFMHRFQYKMKKVTRHSLLVC